MTGRCRFAVLGASLQDIYLIDHDDFVGKKKFTELRVGTKVDIDDLEYHVGGGGTNVATTFARFGHEVVLLSNIGIDSAGDAVLRVLDEEGIDSSYLHQLRDQATGTSIILLDSTTGERTILTHRGASCKFDNLDEKDLDRIKPDWLYATTTRGDMETLARFFKKAKELGVKIMFNPGKLEIDHYDELLSLFMDADIILLNRNEAKQLVPGRVLEELISHLQNLLPTKTILITDGHLGGIATDSQKTLHFGIYEDNPVIDTTGAGDAFGSGFLAHFAVHGILESALTFASANSTSVISHLGAKTGILDGGVKLHDIEIIER